VVTRLTRAEADKAATLGLSPLGFLISIVNDIEQPIERRIACAQAVLPYRHPRLSMLPIASFPHLLEASKEVLDITPGSPPSSVTTINIMPMPSGQFVGDDDDDETSPPASAPTVAEVIDLDATDVTAPETDDEAA
jgi:hypothetical protein